MSGYGVRGAKAAFLSGCESHPAILLQPEAIGAVLPENTYCLIFLTFFRGDVNLKPLVIVTAEENSEP